MNVRRIRAVFYKEWLELLQNRLLVGTMVGVPATMVALILGTAASMSLIPAGEMEEAIPLPAAAQVSIGLDPVQSMLVLLNEQYMFYLLMVPAILPSVIACYSIIGEKDARSLEPLLATPVTTPELLVAKTLIASVPATILAWASYLASVVGMYLLTDPVVTAPLLRPTWTLGLAFLSPLLSVFCTLLGVAISSRVSDVRSAQMLSSLVVLPLVGLSMVVLMGLLWIELWHVVLSAAVVGLLCVGAVYVVSWLFQREAILTRWK